MWEFLDRLVCLALPRIRDFRGVPPRSFDGHGNYSLGLAEQVIYPEIDADKIHRPRLRHHHRDHRPDRRGRTGVPRQRSAFPFRQENR